LQTGLRRLDLVRPQPEIQTAQPCIDATEGSAPQIHQESAPRKILFFDHTSELGGGEIALMNLVVALDHTRYAPIVVVASEGPLIERLQAAGIQTILLPLSQSVAKVSKDTLGGRSLLQLDAIWRVVVYVARLQRLIRASDADLIHTNSLKADIIGGVAGRIARVRVLWHVRDRIADDYLPRSVVRTFRYLCRWLPEVIVANSRSTLDTLCLPTHRTAELAGRCAYVVHDGVSAEAAETVRGEGTTDTPLIGLVGRISPWKGQHIFIEAAAEVRRRFPQARFQIIGSPLFGEEAYADDVRRRATDLGLDDCLDFTGFRTDVPKLIAALDLLVHASTIGEPFGQVVIEGMVAGKPVIATDGGGVPEIVKAGVTGLLVPMGDAAALAQAMLSLLADPERARRMGEAGREHVLNHFTVAHTARKIEQVYDNMLQFKPNAPVMSNSRSPVQS
jgi:glycosyltransferase involved in cell wall biosynthesis